MSCPKGCLILAGVGGMAPTLSKLASTYVNSPSPSLPSPSFFFGLLLFFLIGAVLAFAFSEQNLKKAFTLGICAPGLITNIMAGTNVGDQSSQNSFFNTLPVISSAFAQDPSSSSTATPGPNSTTSKTIIINSNISGSDSSVKKNIPISIIVSGNEGVPKKVAGFSADQKNVIISIPENTTHIKIRAAGISDDIKLPEGEFSKATIESYIEVESKMGFLWALGAGKESKVVSVKSAISETE